MTHLLTASRLKVWQACPRQHHYRYELARVPLATSRALSLGTATHAGLEAWWRAVEDHAASYALPAALAAAEAAYPQHEGDDPYAAALLRALLTAYDARWSAWALTVTVLGVEVPFTSVLRHPTLDMSARTWRVAGKIDVLVRLEDGRVAIIEHKTTSQDAGAGSDYRRKLTLDPQVSTYFDGAEALGHEADLCLYDVLRKPSIKPLLATPPDKQRRKADGTLYANQRERDETPAEYERRLIDALAAEPDKYLLHAEIVRSDAEREAHRFALWHAVRSIEESRAALARAGGDVRAVPQHAHACLAYGTPCAYLPVCEGTARIDDATLYARLTSPHVELMNNENGDTTR